MVKDETTIFKQLNGGLVSWIVKGVLALAVGFAVLWSQLHFVSQSAFEAYKEKQRQEEISRGEKLNGTLLDIATKLQRIADFMEGDKRQEDAITDLQKEVKALQMQSKK